MFLAVLAAFSSLAAFAADEVETPPATECWYPVIGCLKAAEKAFLGDDVRWGSTHTDDIVHRPFLKNFYKPSINDSIVDQMETVASRDHAVVNRFLADHGFNIELRPFDPTGFGTAAILKVAVEWIEPGYETRIQYRGEDKYPAAHIEAGIEVRHVMIAESWGVDVVVIRTKTDDVVYLTLREELKNLLGDTSPFRLTKIANRILSGIPGSELNKDTMGLVVPMVDLNETIDHGWMLGMAAKTAKGEVYQLDQALQQTKFALDEFGAKVESAASIAGSKGINMIPPFVIDAPFIAIVARKGASLPILVADVGPEFWKRPKR